MSLVGEVGQEQSEEVGVGREKRDLSTASPSASTAFASVCAFPRDEKGGTN